MRNSNRIAIRWSRSDRYFGPFTWAVDKSYRPLSLVLSSAGEETPANLRMSALGRTLIVRLPNFIPPYREKEKARYWSEEQIERIGRDWYWVIDKREFGFSLNDGHLSVRYGRSTMGSSTDKSWGYFLPWTQWRHIRISFYGLRGELISTVLDADTKLLDRKKWDLLQEAEAACPKATFSFQDFDGEQLTAITHIEEREWRRGEGWFKWLAWITQPKISRSLSITFSGETGRRKGSWKGGTIGTSISMLPGETHDMAFMRYCRENQMDFVASHSEAQK